MPQEAALLYRFKAGALSRGLLAVKTNDRYAEGLPDILLSSGWLVELKRLDRWPVRGGPVSIGLRPAQELFLLRWARAGGKAGVYFQVGREYMFVPAALCAGLSKPVSQEALLQRTVLRSKSLDDVWELLR